MGYFQIKYFVTGTSIFSDTGEYAYDVTFFKYLVSNMLQTIQSIYLIGSFLPSIFENFILKFTDLTMHGDE